MERGIATKGSEIEIIGLGDPIKTILTGIEMFHKELDRVSTLYSTIHGLTRVRVKLVITWVLYFVVSSANK